MSRISRSLLNIFICLGLLFIFAFNPSLIFAQIEEPPELFINASNPPTEAQAFDPVIMRRRYVEVSFDLLKTVREQIATNDGNPFSIILDIPLFPDAELEAQLDDVNETIHGGYVLSGTISGYPYSEVYLSAQGDILSGSIALLDANYRVSYVEGETHVIEQINQSVLPAEHEDLSPTFIPKSEISAQGIYGDDDGTQLDVLVVYTTNAREAVGGTSAIQSVISQEIDIVNQGYENSEIETRLNLVHTAEVNYDEFAVSWEQNLYDVTEKGDGKLEVAHSLRDQYMADLVVLMTNKLGSYCGIAWVMTSNVIDHYFEQAAFSVVSRHCTGPGNYTMSHEIGHNLGSQHNPENASFQGAYPYSYGYWAPDSSFRTIMAYDGSPSKPRINYFSNPNVYYNGKVTGTSSQDNARTHNNTRLVAAQFRDGDGPTAPIDLEALSISKTQINLSWTDTSSNESSFRVERTIDGQSNWVEIGTNLANDESYSDMTGVCGTTYRYRVRAYSGNGYSAYTPEKVVSTHPCLNAPENLTAGPISNSQIQLSWEDKSSNEDGFEIERRLSGQTDWSSIHTTGINETGYQDSSLQCETGYEYRVRAFNEDGPSTYANTATATTYICHPSGLTGSAASQHQINLNWVDNSALEEGYLLKRSIQGQGNWQEYNLPANTTGFDDTGLSCGETYTYQLWAVKTGEPLSGTPQEQVNIPTHACAPPPAPANLSLTPISGRIVQVTWDDVLDDETGYRVERRVKNTSTWVTAAVLGQDETLCVDEYLEWGTDYEYRVLSINEYGETASDTGEVQTYPYGMFFPLGN